MKKYKVIKIALYSVKTTKNLIAYALLFKEAIEKERIRPDNFLTLLRVNDIKENVIAIQNTYKMNWNIFKKHSDNAYSCILNYAMLMCKECIDKSLWITDERKKIRYF